MQTFLSPPFPFSSSPSFLLSVDLQVMTSRLTKFKTSSSGLGLIKVEKKLFV